MLVPRASVRFPSGSGPFQCGAGNAALDSNLVPAALAAFRGSELNKFIVIGPQASGKSTQSRMLRTRFDLVHISVGEIIRWHLDHRTKLAARIQRILNTGNLIPDEIVLEFMRRRIQQHDWNYGFVLDHFPRTQGQADYLRQNWDIDKVVYLDVPDELVTQRVMDRAKEGWGSGYTKRAVTNPEVLRRRLANYHRRTKPILDVFDRTGTLVHVDARESISGVFSRITRTLGLLEGPV